MGKTIEYKPNEIWCIITGDIVQSSLLEKSEREHLINFFLEDIKGLLKAFSPSCEFLFPNIFRGDSWQMGIFPANQALRNGLFIRTSLKTYFNGLDSRLAFGIGPILFAVEEFVSAGIGPAFTLSGDLLDNMIDTHMLLRTTRDFLGKTKNGKAIDLIVRYMDENISHWTPSQAQAVIGAMKTKQQKEIAKDWHPQPISQQAVSTHLLAANWKLVNESLIYLEELIGDWDNLDQ
jgi:hypothetical protein